jgi:hypothetical protein
MIMPERAEYSLTESALSPFQAEPTQFYEAQHRKQQVIHLKRKAARLGLEIIEVADAA